MSRALFLHAKDRCHRHLHVSVARTELSRRHRRWASIGPALGRCLVFAKLLHRLICEIVYIFLGCKKSQNTTQICLTGSSNSAYSSVNVTVVSEVIGGMEIVNCSG